MHNAYGSFFCMSLQLAGDLLDTGRADVLSLEGHDITRISAKNAAGLILFENDHIVLGENFQRIVHLDAQNVARFHRDGHSAELVNAAYNAC